MSAEFAVVVSLCGSETSKMLNASHIPTGTGTSMEVAS
jgi:hypothetical protein